MARSLAKSRIWSVSLGVSLSVFSSIECLPIQAQIVPVYIAIPHEIDPGMGYDAKPGSTDIYFLPPIDTSAWRLADVEQNRDRVRELFVRVHDSVRSTGELPNSLGLVAEHAAVLEAATA